MFNSKNAACALIFGSGFYASERAFSISGFSIPVESLEQIQPTGNIDVSAFRIESKSNLAARLGGAFHGIFISHDSSASTQSTLQKILSEMGISTYAKMSLIPEPRNSILNINKFTFSIAGKPVCLAQLKAAHLDNNSPIYISGVIPTLNSYTAPNDDDWPDIKMLASELARHAGNTFDEITDSNRFNVNTIKKCVIEADGQWIPAYHLSIDIDSHPYEGVVSDRGVSAIERRSLSIDGIVRGFKHNPFDGKMEDFKIQNLEDSGVMANDVFTTMPLEAHRAIAADHTFLYSENDDRFREANIFAHANVHMDFLRSLVFKKYTSDRIVLVSDGGAIDNVFNGAYFKPKDDSRFKAPTIIVGKSDGIVLQNLEFDEDVVSHELGHYVIYSRVNSIPFGFESIIIHEALSDAFVGLRTHDSCIGDSICPRGAADAANGGTCWIANKCLRTMENDLNLATTSIPNSSRPFKEAHYRSQIISGMIWDIVQSRAVSAKVMSKILIDGIDLLVGSSGFRDLILGMLAADQALTGGQTCASILNRARQRGFSSYLSDVDCDLKLIPQVNSEITSANDSNSDTNHNRELFGIKCGVLGDENTWDFFTIVALLFPLLFTEYRALKQMLSAATARQPSSDARKS